MGEWGGWGEKNSSMKLYELFHLELIKWWNFTKWMKLIVIQIWMYVDERPTYIKYILNLQVNLQFFFCFFFFFVCLSWHTLFSMFYICPKIRFCEIFIYFSQIYQISKHLSINHNQTTWNQIQTLSMKWKMEWSLKKI